jgi:uncharacterized protein (DUF697 family)/GTPase Era involved in 16S rRNA processing
MKRVRDSLPPSTDNRGNVLVIGGSGVGKSTLINAVLGEEVAPTSWGRAGTEELKLYEDERAPFRLIDTMGFEVSSKRQHKAVKAVKRWSKECAKEGRENTQINVIWFCVDGTAARLFSDTIAQLNEATDIWKSVPVIAVITKSYSEFEKQSNVRMVREAFEAQHTRGPLDDLLHKPDYSKRLRKIIPVVAQAWQQSETNIVPPSGIETLIETTNELMPEGMDAARGDLERFILARKRALSQGVIAPCVTAGAVVGALPLPIADAAVLGPVEAVEVTTLARIYGLNKDDGFDSLMDTIIDVGTVSVAAKGAISVLKAIPGINVAAEVLNAAVAASIIAALGEGCVYVFEQMSTGKMSEADLETVRKYFEQLLQNREFLGKVSGVLKSLKDGADVKTVSKAIAALFTGKE